MNDLTEALSLISEKSSGMFANGEYSFNPQPPAWTLIKPARMLALGQNGGVQIRGLGDLIGSVTMGFGLC